MLSTFSVHASSAYQPKNVYPKRVGVGNVANPSAYVNVVAAPSGNWPSFNTYSIAIGSLDHLASRTTSLAIAGLIEVTFSPSKYQPKNSLPALTGFANTISASV